jgi:hypothetical protein
MSSPALVDSAIKPGGHDRLICAYFVRHDWYNQHVRYAGEHWDDDHRKGKGTRQGQLADVKPV